MTRAQRRILNYLLPCLTGWGWAAALLLPTACTPEPPLHLYDASQVTTDLPVIDLDLNVYWDYDLGIDYDIGIDYDWRLEWFYGWDDEDSRIFGQLGYTEPNVFSLRRYFTGQQPYAPHTSVLANTVEGRHFLASYNWGYWDILVWNDIETLDGVQSLVFDETTSLDSVTAYTNPSMRAVRYNAPRFTQAFYAPEPLFAAYEQAIDIDRSLKGFVYDPDRNVYVRTLNMMLRPITYIYLTQVILHNNRGRVTAVEGSSDLSGMARTTNVNTGRAGNDAITVYYNVRLKKDCDYGKPYGTHEAYETRKSYKPYEAYRSPEAQASYEKVDIIGGRLMTFGIPGTEANAISRIDDITDNNRHYLGVNILFNNTTDSTLVFDVTDQVRRRYKGGVITVELDLDTVPLPTRRGGSGFNAVVLEPDSVTRVIEL